MSNLRSGVLFSEERERKATRDSPVSRRSVRLFPTATLALLYFRAPPKKGRLIGGWGGPIPRGGSISASGFGPGGAGGVQIRCDTGTDRHPVPCFRPISFPRVTRALGTRWFPTGSGNENGQYACVFPGNLFEKKNTHTHIEGNFKTNLFRKIIQAFYVL